YRGFVLPVVPGHPAAARYVASARGDIVEVIAPQTATRTPAPAGPPDRDPGVSNPRPRPSVVRRPRVPQAVIRRRRAVAIWAVFELAVFAAWGIGVISHQLRPVTPIAQGSAAGLAKQVAKRGYEHEQELGRIEASRILGYT